MSFVKFIITLKIHDFIICNLKTFHYKFKILFFSAPPTFIQRLDPYAGSLYSASEVSLTCQVECYPLCEIHWLKNGIPIKESDIYSIRTTKMPADPSKSDFEGVRSTLIWNMTAFAGGVDRANFTCQSSSNSVGAGVSSTTAFRVECKFFLYLLI